MIKLSFVLGFACLGVASQSFAGVSGVYDANNVLVGEYAESISVIHSVRGFRFSVNGQTGVVKPVGSDLAGISKDIAGVGYLDGELVYSSVNCTGQAYVGITASSPAGGIITNVGNNTLYYVTKAPAVSTLAFGSSYSNPSGCNAIQPTIEMAVPALPNDPAITGVPNTPFTPPLHLEMVPLSQFFQLFKNGFESSFVGYTYYLRGQTDSSWRSAAVAEKVSRTI